VLESCHENALKFLALLSAGMFAGAAFYLTTVEHPARLSLWLWLLGGIPVGAVVPFTLVFAMPTNRLLLDEAKQPGAHALDSLVAKWARLHAVRTVSSLLSFLALLSACIFYV
jgi:hypothetical protein